MDKKIKEKYLKAGKINKETLKFAEKYVKEGRNLLDIAEKIEKTITGQGEGARPAWPVNLSINENAAHQTASLEEDIILKGNEVLKVDIGVHIDGYISDSAVTIDLSGEHGKMVEAAEEALEAAASALEKRSTAAIGKAIEETIKAKGFNPVQNLSGHFLQQWVNHAPPSVPNVAALHDKKIGADSVLAIEPFATNGQGYVREGGKAEIFMLEEKPMTRNPAARKVADFIEQNYKTLPFAERWLVKELKVSEFQRKVAFRELMKSRALKAFPTLHEEKGKIVTQAETTFIVEDDEITRLV